MDVGNSDSQVIAGCKEPLGKEACVQVGMRSDAAQAVRLKPETLPARYWRWAEPKQEQGESKQVDGVELSLRARWMNQLMNAPVRNERVAEIRAELAQGTYDSARKLDIALDRLIDDAAGAGG